MTEKEHTQADEPTIFKGHCVSYGSALGTALCLHGRKRQFFRVEIAPENVAAEVERLEAAVAAAAERLNALINDPPTAAAADIFDAQLLMLEGSSLVDAARDHIAQDHVNAEWAVKTVSEDLISKQKSSADPRIRERYQDIEDVSERILNHLGGLRGARLTLPPGTVLVASEIRPSTLVQFRETPPAAIVAEQGGWTSHAFILARDMGIPAVTGIRKAAQRLTTGQRVAVDANEGTVTLGDPTRTAILTQKLATATAAPSHLGEIPFIMRANLDDHTRYSDAVAAGADGIGLLRSEYLFPDAKGWPDEEQQFNAYAAVAEAVGTAGARIRTFDFGIDQVTFGSAVPEKNPALGLRAVRLGLSRKRQFAAQVRAIARANSANNLSIVLPMVAGVEDIIESKLVIDRELERLSEDGQRRSIDVGVMIELPSAVLSIEEITEIVSFVCIGTNDLVQYLLGADRDNGGVAHWYQTLHPAVLRALKMVIEACEKASIPASVCGEMAGSPFYLPLLVGLGAREVSVKVSSLGPVTDALSRTDADLARKLAERALTARTAQEVEELLAQAAEN